MELINKSYRSRKELQQLTNFVVQFHRFPGLAKLVIKDNAANKFTEGSAHRINPHEPCNRLCPGLVQIQLSQELPYPQANEYIKEVGPIVFYNWKEEFVFVLAHEFHHIDQAYTNYLNKNIDYRAEMEAEQKAVEILSNYRKTVSPKSKVRKVIDKLFKRS